MHCSKTQENYNWRKDFALGYRNRMHDVPSPCTGICRIDPTDGWCTGCKRTLEEIADWPMLRAHEKRAVLRKLTERS